MHASSLIVNESLISPHTGVRSGQRVDKPQQRLLQPARSLLTLAKGSSARRLRVKAADATTEKWHAARLTGMNELLCAACVLNMHRGSGYSAFLVLLPC